MSMLSSSDLTYMRDAIEEILPDTCNILSVTLAADGQGGNTETWGTATASVDCRLDARSGKVQLGGDVIQPFHTYTLTLPHGTSIGTNNRVEVNSETFTISSIDTGKSWSACIRAELERV